MNGRPVVLINEKFPNSSRELKRSLYCEVDNSKSTDLFFRLVSLLSDNHTLNRLKITGNSELKRFHLSFYKVQKFF